MSAKFNIPKRLSAIVANIVAKNSGTCDTVTLSDSVFTITTTGNTENMRAGMLLEIENNQFEILSVSRGTFTIAEKLGFVTSITTGAEWKIALYYDYGHLVEVSKTVEQKDKSETERFKRMPLLWLMLDIPETRATGENALIFDVQADLRFALTYFSSKDYKAEQRIENIHEPILYPLIDLIINEFKESRIFSFPLSETPAVRLYDRYRYGSEQANANYIGSTITDAVEIEFNGARIKAPVTCNYSL